MATLVIKGPDGRVRVLVNPGDANFPVIGVSTLVGTLVGILGKSNGAPVLLAYERSREDGDFLKPMGQFPLGAAIATGVVILP